MACSRLMPPSTRKPHQDSSKDCYRSGARLVLPYSFGPSDRIGLGANRRTDGEPFHSRSADRGDPCRLPAGRISFPKGSSAACCGGDVCRHFVGTVPARLDSARTVSVSVSTVEHGLPERVESGGPDYLHVPGWHGNQSERTEEAGACCGINQPRQHHSSLRTGVPSLALSVP